MAEAWLPLLGRVAEAWERLAPPPPPVPDLAAAPGYIWQGHGQLEPVASIHAPPLELLQGVTPQKETLLANTRQFASGGSANNALLWGARGMGKSSLLKAVCVAVQRKMPQLAVVEIAREELASLPRLLALLEASGRRFILFCDDLSFGLEDSAYKCLKTVLEGGLRGRPGNVLFYATSNRRHLMAREMIENEQAGAIHAGEAVEEKVSLSDRFGLWLGFHACDQETYFAMVDAYLAELKLPLDAAAVRQEALQWAAGRGGRSGRVAAQFMADLAGRHGR